MLSLRPRRIDDDQILEFVPSMRRENPNAVAARLCLGRHARARMQTLHDV